MSGMLRAYWDINTLRNLEEQNCNLIQVLGFSSWSAETFIFIFGNNTCYYGLDGEINSFWNNGNLTHHPVYLIKHCLLYRMNTNDKRRW